MITFRGIKFGPVPFLGFLSHKSNFTIETTTQDKKKARKALIGESKGAQARKACRRMLMMGKTRKRVSMIGKARRREVAQVRNLADS